MEYQHHVLFVDDEHLLQNLFTKLLNRHGMEVTSCSGAMQAIEKLKKTTFDLVITDFMMPDMDGAELLAHIRQHYPDTRVIMITAHANVQHAVRTMKTGAVDYIPKPFATEELLERVKAALNGDITVDRPAAVGRRKRRSGRNKRKAVSFIGQHSSVQRLHEIVERVASNRAPVFVRGESGTGKEVLARLIHDTGDRASGPFLALNCANLPRELVESHLFGHRKGAFTGAIEDMTGAFESADGGTLLLDEITEIDPRIQAKLLRVLQEYEIQKVGSTEVKRVDVRVIATSNRDMQEAIQASVFREDLYMRLAVFPIIVPPLRDRRSDIPELVAHFVDKYAKVYDLPAKQVDEQLLQDLMTGDWPGNVRQLENMVLRGVLLSADREVIERRDIFDSIFLDGDLDGHRSGDGANMDVIQTIDEMERVMIMKTLDETNNNQQEAARLLGISARTIRNKLKRYREEGLLA